MIDEERKRIVPSQHDRQALERDAFGPPIEKNATVSRMTAQAKRAKQVSQQKEYDDKRKAILDLAKKNKAEDRRQARREEKVEREEKRKLADMVTRIQEQAAPDSPLPNFGTQVSV
jgi:hypothetical protein